MGVFTFFNPASRYKHINQTWLITLLVFPIVLWVLPSTFFDNTGIEICPSKFLFDFECFGCGTTRAVMHFHHFEFREAIFFNYNVLFVYPFLVVIWILWVKKAWQRQTKIFAKK